MASLSVEQARMVVLLREGTCIRRILEDPSAPCRDRGGMPITRYSGPMVLEIDRIRDAPTAGKAPGHDDPFRMVAVCSGDHRGVGGKGGEIWATKKEVRSRIREYLSDPKTIRKTEILIESVAGRPRE